LNKTNIQVPAIAQSHPAQLALLRIGHYLTEQRRQTL
jgi:hypothetical protein